MQTHKYTHVFLASLEDPHALSTLHSEELNNS